MKKYKISYKSILGHSDISPNRKKDPGEKFPWKDLAKDKLCLWHRLKLEKIKKLRKLELSLRQKREFFKNLHKIGYIKHKDTSLEIHIESVIKAFQRRFRQEIVNGKIDKECFFISENIAKKLR